MRRVRPLRNRASFLLVDIYSLVRQPMRIISTLPPAAGVNIAVAPLPSNALASAFASSRALTVSTLPLRAASWIGLRARMANPRSLLSLLFRVRIGAFF